MTIKKPAQVEQVSLEFIVKNAFDNFTKAVLFTRTKVLLIGGYVDQSAAMKAYLFRTRPDIDRRRKLGVEDENYVSMVESYAADADQYINWVRLEGGQPVWRDALVSYCSAFENCLKAIAVAFMLSEFQTETWPNAQVIIPSEDLTRARRKISKQWSEVEGDMPKVRQFFEAAVRSRKAAKHFYALKNDLSEPDWEICSTAFQVRNAIIHNLGYMHQSVSLGKLDLYASWQIELNQQAAATVADAFSRALSPFDPNSLGL